MLSLLHFSIATQ